VTRDPGSGTDRDPLTDPEAPFYTIGQVSELVGVPAATLRRFDDESIVSPGRSTGGQRRYSRNQVEQLREVRELTDAGVTLPGVRMVLALRRQVDGLEAELAETRAALRNAEGR